jgi:hypothetical protein
VVAQPHPLGVAGERCRRDDGGLDLRLLPLVVARILAEECVGDDQAEHRVTQELQRLVVGHPARGVFRGA